MKSFPSRGLNVDFCSSFISFRVFTVRCRLLCHWGFLVIISSCRNTIDSHLISISVNKNKQKLNWKEFTMNPCMFAHVFTDVHYECAEVSYMSWTVSDWAANCGVPSLQPSAHSGPDCASAGLSQVCEESWDVLLSLEVQRSSFCKKQLLGRLSRNIACQNIHVINGNMKM